jgi:hypothetical protein
VLSDVRYLPAVCFLKDSTSLSNLVLIGGAGAAADPDLPEERKVGEGVGLVEPAPLPSRNPGAAVYSTVAVGRVCSGIRSSWVKELRGDPGE